eukprot:11323203-Alexandrium_andersonii.AAC.1
MPMALPTFNPPKHLGISEDLLQHMCIEWPLLQVLQPSTGTNRPTSIHDGCTPLLGLRPAPSSAQAMRAPQGTRN